MLPGERAWSRIAEVSRRLSGGEKDRPRRADGRRMWPRRRSSRPQIAPAMIAGMVDGLAQRLKRDGKDLAGWLRLVNAYAVLGRKNDARAALAQARQQLAGDDKAMAELAALAKRLGLGS